MSGGHQCFQGINVMTKSNNHCTKTYISHIVIIKTKTNKTTVPADFSIHKCYALLLYSCNPYKISTELGFIQASSHPCSWFQLTDDHVITWHLLTNVTHNFGSR